MRTGNSDNCLSCILFAQKFLGPQDTGTQFPLVNFIGELLFRSRVETKIPNSLSNKKLGVPKAYFAESLTLSKLY